MKMKLRKILIAFFISMAMLPFDSFSQDLSGIWQGSFETDGGEKYRLEFQITQTKSKTVTGVSYSYLDTRFYGKATMTGNFQIQNKIFQIQEIKTVEVKNMGGGGTCIMNYRLSYSKTGDEEILEGIYIGKTETKDPDIKTKWGDCGGGTVILRRVESSDFYVEPFLRTPPKTDTIIKKPVTKPVVKTPPVTTKKTTTITTPKKIISQPKKDTISRKTDPIVIEKPKEQSKISVPLITRSRENELVKTFVVTSDEVIIRLYDNGEIDDDSISVYLDGKPIILNQRLSAAPITTTIKLDKNNPEHTLIMVAENMGRIPPNTALMIVQDGNNRFQASITSTEQKNAMVRFRYEKK